MSLKALKQIESEASSSESSARAHDRASADLAKIRTGPYSLTDAIDKVFSGWRYGSDEVGRDELYAVINEMAADIYRIAEMRLAAKGRFHKVQAAQKRAIITVSILPLPELEKEEVL